jgi:hypothetical protein
MHRLSRFIAVAALATLVSATAVAPVAGWANGGIDGNGYGTHDWILDEALDEFGSGQADWIKNRRQIALLATDDPDTLFYVHGEHTFYETGKGRGAVHEIAEYYDDAIDHYAAGNYDAAAKDIGILSHFYGDILQPWHTAYAGGNSATDDAVHHDYEMVVQAKTNSSDESSGWQWDPGEITPGSISNIRAAAISAAAYSRAKWSELNSEFIAAGRDNLTSRASALTGAVLKRAIRDLANVIYSVQRGKGNAPPVSSVSASVKFPYVAQNEDYQYVKARVKDANGNPLEGVAVLIDWPKPSGGTTRIRRYTDKDGYAKYVGGVGASPLGVKRTIKVTVTTRDITKTTSTWYMATPKLADGEAGFKSWVNDHTLKPGQTVRVGSLARDRNGKPVANLKVTWKWDYNGKIITTTGYTNSEGKAYSSRLITSATTRAKVIVVAYVQSGGLMRKSKTYFYRI